MWTRVQIQLGTCAACIAHPSRYFKQPGPAEAFFAEAEMHRLQTGRDPTNDMNAASLNVRSRQIHVRCTASDVLQQRDAASQILLRIAACLIVEVFHTPLPGIVDQKRKFSKISRNRGKSGMIFESPNVFISMKSVLWRF